MKIRAAIFASPALCIGVLSVIAVDNARHVKPRDAEPYHARARAAISQFPYAIIIRNEPPVDYWTGNDVKVPDAAVKLLHPNALVSRRYTHHSPSGRVMLADLLISQCADSRDMTGHYPPMCYPSNGEELLGSRAFHLKAGDRWIDGIEYQFKAKPNSDGWERKSVYNFFVIPGQGVRADIRDVRAAAGDYQRRCFGAAQFQVIVDADQPPEVRDEVFSTLVGADVGIIKLLEFADVRD